MRLLDNFRQSVSDPKQIAPEEVERFFKQKTCKKCGKSMWEDFPRLAALTGGGIALTLLDAGQTALGVMPESEDDDPTASDVETVVKFIREPGVTGLMNAHTVKFLESAHQAYEWDGNEEEVYCPKHKHLLNDD